MVIRQPAMLRQFRRYPQVTRRLMVARCLRSSGQGILVVDFSLYLHALGWSAVAIGGLLSAAGLIGAALSVLVGLLSDRLGRRRFVLGYEILSLAAALTALLFSQGVLLSLAAILAGFGRGANGSAGPFAPAEQAWLSTEVSKAERSPLFSVNAAMGFLGMGTGALLAGGVNLFHGWLPGALEFRPIFAWVAVISITNWVILVRLPDNPSVEPPGIGSEKTHQENRLMARLGLVNAFSGLAVGIMGPLMSYWFAVRFHEQPDAIGTLMAASFFATAFGAMLAARMSRQIGVVMTMVYSRYVAVGFSILLPLMPSFGLAAVVYLAQTAATRGTQGTTQALSVNLVRDARRGLASSLNSVSRQIPAAVGPTVTGALLDAGNWDMPFFLGALLMFGYAGLYRRMFHALDQTRSVPQSSSSHAL